MNNPFLLHNDSILNAESHAKSGRFTEMLAICQRLMVTRNNNAETLLKVGALLLNFGFLSRARACFMRLLEITPDDLRAIANLANIAHETADHTESHRLRVLLQQHLPHHQLIRRNILLAMEYDPAVSDCERLKQARAWGRWATAQTGDLGVHSNMSSLKDRPLRIGYVSADFCQHTVGLFVKDVIAAHNPERISAFAYHAGQTKDWVTKVIRRGCHYRDVTNLNDADLAGLVKQDEIDVLVDLSGHTAGSRLTMFAYQPAPVQVSWLGYFATTGLACIDAILLDKWHAPDGTQNMFVEPIISLTAGRFCYQPVPWAPDIVSPPSVLKTGHITFGCFNNTAKYNAEVIDVWSRILINIPDSRLVLKWRTFADEDFCETVRSNFVQRGIEADRIELRRASFHADLLQEYADIDIALDPFPFTGGLTSCEALWMGVAVVTWPQSRVVSRQTFALLSAIGLPELAAKDVDDYVRIATTLAKDKQRLTTLRNEMRKRMLASSLMDLQGFTRSLEQCLIKLYRDMVKKREAAIKDSKKILHAGSGHRKNGAKLPAIFQAPEWREIRLDIDPSNEPDIIGSLLDMVSIQDASVDAIYSAHNIEHVYAHEVPIMLNEFLRVLKPDGFLVITCPDLQAVCLLVADDKLTEPAYHSPAGPISPLDILYGHRAALAKGNSYMAHKCGFTLNSLTTELKSAGFKTIAGKRRTKGLDLWMVATKLSVNEFEIRELAKKVLPE